MATVNQMGWVLMVSISFGNEKFLFAPDVQGPMSSHTLQLILAAKPAVLMLGGPPLYLGGFRVEMAQLEQGLRNLATIVQRVPLVILEHHALRDESWKQKMGKIFQQAAEAGHRIVTAAEYAGKENQLLESKRKQLYRDHPPSEEFKQWMKTLNNKKIAKPPI